MRSALSLALLALSAAGPAVLANPEPCSDHPGVVHPWDAVKYIIGDSVKSTEHAIAKEKQKAEHAAAVKAEQAQEAKEQAIIKDKKLKKKVQPKVEKPTKHTVINGAVNSVKSFAGVDYIPLATAEKLEQELQKAIDEQLAAAKKVVTQTLVRTQTPDSTITAPANAATPVFITVTEVKTIDSSDSLSDTAALNIKRALEKAFAAAGLSLDSLDKATTKSLEKCLNTVMAAGGLPEGYSCLTSSGKDSEALTATLNTILQQFVGILPNVVLQSVFDAVTPVLGELLPSSQVDLVEQIQDSIKSVIATLSGSSVTALEQVQQCYTESIKLKGNASALECFTKQGGAMSTLQTASNGVLEQFVGVLPASLVSKVKNILNYNLEHASSPNSELANQVSSQISNAIDSVASTLSGNTVTLAETLQKCAAELIRTGDGKAAQKCITSGQAPQVASTMIRGISEQFAGYLPSSFFTDLTKFSKSFVQNSTINKHNLTQAQANKIFDSYFNNATSYGPAFVTCFHQVQDCVTKAIVAGGDKKAVCKGPVAGCTLIKKTTTSSSKTTTTTSKAGKATLNAAKIQAAASSTSAAKSTTQSASTTAKPSVARRTYVEGGSGNHRAPRPGLVVNVEPGASAFFAGEVFTATITFKNTCPVSTRDPLSLPPGSHRGPYGQATSSATDSTATLESSLRHGSDGHAQVRINSRHQSDQWGRSTSNASSSGGERPASHSRRPSFASASSLNLATTATPKSQSSFFGTATSPASNGTTNRSVTSVLPPSIEKTKSFPNRKGLIGRPLPPAPVAESKRSANGLYSGGPRRPGAVANAHARSQSMAFSSPDLVNGSSAHADEPSLTKTLAQKAHQRNRLGGSMAAPQLAAALTSKSSTSRAPMPARLEEEPSYMDDAAFPPAASSNSAGTSSLPRGLRQHEGDPDSPTEGQRHPSRTVPDQNDSDSGSDYDPTDSQASLPGRGFYGLKRNETMDDISQVSFDSRANVPRPAPVPPIPRPSSAAARNQYFHPPDTIALLWSFAHLEGSFEVDDSLVKTNEFVRLKKELVGGQGAAIGGGTLNERRSSGARPGARGAGPGAAGGGWRDWLWGSSQLPDPAPGAASLEERKTQTMMDKSIPTFSTPPSILAVDLILEPGESKSYTFSIRIPADLPPSFRGRAIKFNYNLVVGTSRTRLGTVMNPSAARGAARDATSRVMRVPIRVYNHVGVTGARPFYDLTNPIVYHRDESVIVAVDDEPAVRKTAKLPHGRREFEEYASNLLDSVAINSPEMIATAMSPELKPLQSPILESVPSLRPERQSRSRGIAIGEEEESGGCKAAVEIVTRNSQKVSYDINKDGYLVSKLTLVKSAYRLGETVNGSVVINSGEGRVLRVSVRLETHELVETTISTRTANQIRQITRRLHAEHHETTLDSARIGFALAIPSGATPDFGTSGVKLQWSVRLSFLVIPPSPEAPTSNPNLTTNERERVLGSQRPSGLQNSSPTSAAARHGRSKSFAYGFEPAVPLTLPPPPVITPTGAVHLMPVSDLSTAHSSFRAVPDLGYVPVMFKSNAPEPPPPPGPLQRSASGASLHRTTNSLSIARQQVKPDQTGSVVLVPAKVDVVECSIPIKVYPGNTPFKPTTSIFAA
ncbi:hypothetical protein ACM66B_004535 [Microbotryomycetes sp. NB124-2]